MQTRASSGTPCSESPYSAACEAGSGRDWPKCSSCAWHTAHGCGPPFPGEQSGQSRRQIRATGEYPDRRYSTHDKCKVTVRHIHRRVTVSGATRAGFTRTRDIRAFASQHGSPTPPAAHRPDSTTRTRPRRCETAQHPRGSPSLRSGRHGAHVSASGSRGPADHMPRWADSGGSRAGSPGPLAAGSLAARRTA